MRTYELMSLTLVAAILAVACDTDKATNVSATSATLNLKPDPNACPEDSQPCTVFYEVSGERASFGRGAYGDAPLAYPSTKHRRTTPKLFPDDGEQSLSHVISSLRANTQYYFRVCGGSDTGPSLCAAVRTFRTAPVGRACAVHSVPVGSTSIDHGDPSSAVSIARKLSEASVCDVVELDDDAVYTIQQRLVIPNGVTLRGKHDDARYARQQIAAGSAFPANAAMILLKKGSVLQRASIDGMNRAYRIVDLTTKSDPTDLPSAQYKDYVIQENTLAHTYNRAGSGGADVSIISGSRTENIDISNNKIHGAGIHTAHGWGADYSGQWETKGRGVLVRQSNNLFIVSNAITHTTMGGIDLTTGRIAIIHNNVIEWTGRNSEYKTSKNDTTKSIQDAITGYHNYRQRPEDEKNLPNQWTITDNMIRYAGNHGIHVGGRGIVLKGNIIEKVFQSGINFYDQRNDAQQGYAECNVEVQVGGPTPAEKNSVRDTGYTASDATLYRAGFAWSPVATQLARKARYEGMPNFNMTTEDNDLGGGEVMVDTANASCGHRFGF